MARNQHISAHLYVAAYAQTVRTGPNPKGE